MRFCGDVFPAVVIVAAMKPDKALSTSQVDSSLMHTSLLCLTVAIETGLKMTMFFCCTCMTFLSFGLLVR